MPWDFMYHVYIKFCLLLFLSYTGGPSLADKKGDGSKNTTEKKVHINR